MNCEGPLYEKFDSELEDDIDEDVYDVTDEEEQEESERQHNDFMPNLSDDG